MNEQSAEVNAWENLPSLPLLRLLQITSPSLPIGTFAYSQGLEEAIHLTWVTDEATAWEWISGLLQHSLATLDLPILARLYQAFLTEDDGAVAHWNAILFASRGSAELQAEDRQLGSALAQVLSGLEVVKAAAWVSKEVVTHATLFALASVAWEIPLAAAAAGYAFAYTEAQVAAATRLCPLGQRTAQRLLSRALPLMRSLVPRALSLPDDALGATCPAQSMASALHETLYSRLCRS